MRETRLTRAADHRVVRTDDIGTMVLDAKGQALAEHGTDMHETLIAAHRDEGWEVTADAHRPPDGATGEPPPAIAGDTGAPGLKATENDAESS